MKHLDARLRRLAVAVPAGCGHCRLWGPCVYEVGDRGPDRGERCPRCGRVIPIRLLRRIVLVPASEEE